MDTSDDKKSYNKYQISKIDEEKVTEDIEVLNLGKLSLQKKMDNIEKYYDEIKQIDMIDDKESDERDKICEKMKKE